MTRTKRFAPTFRSLTAVLFCTLLLMAACDALRGPGKEYKDKTEAMSGPALLRERLALTDDIRAKEQHREGLTDEARGAVDDDLDQAKARLRFVNDLLADERFAVHDLRYKVQAIQVRPEPKEQVKATAQPPAAEPKGTEPEIAASGPVEPAAAEAKPTQEPKAAVSSAPPSSQAAPALPPTVEAVTWTAGDALTVRIAVGGNGAPKCRTFALTDPARVVVDVFGMGKPSPSLPKRHTLDSSLAKSIRLGWHPEKDFVRIVLDAAAPGLRHNLTTGEGQAVLTLSRP